VHTIVDFVQEGEEGRGKAPLQLVVCSSCSLLQLRHSVDSDTLFRTFWYRSGINEQMKVALTDVVQDAKDTVRGFKLGDVVGDIGSNDGTLLSFCPKELVRVGFEPAIQLVDEAARKVEATFVGEYFDAKLALAASNGKKYKVLFAIAMFYDLEDPNQFLRDCVEALDSEEGVLVIQMNYLATMMRNLTFDNIGHEHLCYYSLGSLDSLMQRNSLQIVDAQLNDVNGGSIRVTARPVKNSGRKSVWRPKGSLTLTQAQEFGMFTEASYRNFGERVKSTAHALREFLVNLKLRNKVVYAYGASTRGMTLLQTIFPEGRSAEYLAGVAERDEKKIGRKMAGLNLPIVSEQEAREKADYMLVLPYHFWGSISQREKSWMLTGGKMLLPLPFPRVVKMVDLEGNGKFVLCSHELDKEMTEMAQV
jgi:NDP-4-keto-2,6-dideoxyhexose 3-C-methyltransferase